MTNLFDEPLYPPAMRLELTEAAQSSKWVYFGMSVQVFVMLLALVICFIWIADYFINQSQEKSIYVTSSLSEERIRSISSLLEQTYNIHRARRELSKLAWIKSAQIEKILDKSWVLTIEENLPVAQFVGKGYYFADGSMLKEELPIESVPLLSGELEPIPQLAPIMAQLTEQLRSYDMRVQQFIVGAGGILSLHIENGIMLHLGSRDYAQRLGRLEIFMRNYGNKLGRIHGIDLRYDNAVAVLWKERTSSL